MENPTFKDWIKTQLRKALYTAVLIGAGVIYGQYHQPIPLDISYKSHLPSTAMADMGTADFNDNNFGYTDKERAEMNALTNDALPVE